jgi:hypothetical protein
MSFNRTLSTLLCSLSFPPTFPFLLPATTPPALSPLTIRLRRDYLAPRLAGMRTLLLQRPSAGDHPNPRYEDERDEREQNVKTVESLAEVLEWIVEENASG